MAVSLTDQRRARTIPYLLRTAPVATTLAVIARELASADTLPLLMDQLIAVIPTVFESADHAGVVLATTAGVAPAAATDDAARRFDSEQLRRGEGPTVQVAGGDADALLVGDLDQDERWPQWRAALPPGQLGSCLSLRLDSGWGTLGALTLYAAAPHVFTDDTVVTGTALAIHAAAAVAAVTKRDNLRIAMDSRDVIGQAKGILMERHRFTAEEAFDLLVAASQRTNRKLREVAEELALTGLVTTERPAR